MMDSPTHNTNVSKSYENDTLEYSNDSGKTYYGIIDNGNLKGLVDHLLKKDKISKEQYSDIIQKYFT